MREIILDPDQRKQLIEWAQGLCLTNNWRPEQLIHNLDQLVDSGMVTVRYFKHLIKVNREIVPG